ncbi:MAG: Ig-like domain-containing protein [Archaeoglobus sp.]|nr:Ig-like domain-containing protein [Archaeoglobus sp.]
MKHRLAVFLIAFALLLFSGCSQPQSHHFQKSPHSENSGLKPTTEVEFPGSKTKITLPKANESLPPPPYTPYNIIPEPEATNVPLDTVISVSFPRPPAYLKLEIEPETKFSHVKKEMTHYSAKFTFYLAEPLKPGTKYTVTIIAGQEKPPGQNSSPYLKKSWNFTTLTPEIEIMPMPGKYFNCSLGNKSNGNESKILLEDARIEFVFLKEEDMCPPTAAWYGVNPGDLGIAVTGHLKSEYDRDYWTSLFARAYDSKGEVVGGSLDPGHICGVIPLHLKSNGTSYFEVHLKYRKDIRLIKIFSGCVYKIPPP